MTPAEREARILGLSAQVLLLARKRRASLPSSVTLDELVSAAWVGAIKAVDRFDTQRGCTLATYAERRIRGAMLDYLRSLDPLSRDQRLQVSRGEASEIVQWSLDQTNWKDISFGSRLADERAARAQLACEAAIDLAGLFARAELSPNQASMLASHALGGETFRAVGRRAGLCMARAFQICAAALRKLRAAA